MASPAFDITQFEAAELKARIDLAAVHRLSYRFGWNDGIYNHYTYMVPGQPDQFLVKPHGLLMSEITASNLIVVDTEGKTVRGDGAVEATALHIHAAIHLEVPHATCVLHVHPPYSTWVTCLDNNRLGMVSQTGLRFFEQIAYDDEYGGLAVARDEGERMARMIGNHRVAMHCNHGVTTVAPTVAEANWSMVARQRALLPREGVRGVSPRHRLRSSTALRAGRHREAHRGTDAGHLRRGSAHQSGSVEAHSRPRGARVPLLKKRTPPSGGVRRLLADARFARASALNRRLSLLSHPHRHP